MNAFVRNNLMQLFLMTILLGSSAWAYDASMLSRIMANAPGLPPKAVQDALKYLEAHPTVFSNKNFMAIVNFDQPSTEDRFYLIDLQSGVVKASLVSHGASTSDPTNRAIAKTFSNRINSGMSSLGFYSTFKPGENDVKGEAGVFSENRVDG